MKAMKELKPYNYVEVLPADKGNATVIFDDKTFESIASNLSDVWKMYTANNKRPNKCIKN